MSEIKDKKIGIFEITPERNLSGDEITVKRYIHGYDRLWAYVRELTEKEKFAAKAAGAEQSILFRSTYYYYIAYPVKDKYTAEKEAIETIYTDNKGRYGYRRILAVLRQKGYAINHKTVLKLMNQLNLHGKRRKSKYKSYKGEVGKIAANILSRDFKSHEPYEKLVTDVTEFNVCNDKVYLSPVMDLYNREIISYSISLSPNFYQTREMLSGLVERLPATAKPLLHSDQGWQYQQRVYQRILKEHNITQSMSRKGNCLDNSPMENFFGRLKVEMFYGEQFKSVEDFTEKLVSYIAYYNNDRISLKLKGLSPVSFRTQSQSVI